MEKSILITGANGFIGSNLCRYFIHKGYKVYGLVRETSDLHFLSSLDVSLLCGDLIDMRKVSLPPDLDLVVHSASLVSDQASDELCEKNIFQGSVNLAHILLERKRGLRRFIYISSALVLGYGKQDISEENPGKQADFLAYTRYKRKTEDYLFELHHRRGFPVVVIRPADVYGPNDRTSSLHLLREIERGVPTTVGHGKWILPFCYIDNLSQAVYLACEKENLEGRAFTVTDGTDITWKEFFSGLQKRLGKKQRMYIPRFLPYLVALMMKIIALLIHSYSPPLTFYRIRRITSHTSYDISKTVDELGYMPVNDLEGQLDAIVNWYLEEKAAGHISV